MINSYCLFLFLFGCIQGAWGIFDPKPIAVIPNPCERYTLINSVDCWQNQFCVTYTQGNRIGIYRIDPSGKVEIVQILANPKAKLSDPQHAIFADSGWVLMVANWSNESIAIYKRQQDGLFCATPSFIPPVEELSGYKPHGMAVSPCGFLLAIAYGASSDFGSALAIYRLTDYRCVSVIKDQDLPGIPKGVAFSSNGKSLLVTFSDLNALAIFDINRKKQILPSPRQIIQGPEKEISRPEDVKISADGKYCALSNSDSNTVTFYEFDNQTNRVTSERPVLTLKNPEAELSFPHGLAFSDDGRFFFITQFGPVQTNDRGDLILDKRTKPKTSKVNVYKRV